jgi:hypothetical protein
MISHPFILLTLVGRLLSQGQDKASDLKLFECKNGGFSVLMPGTPKERSAPVAGNEPAPTQWYVESSNGTCLVARFDNNEMKNANEKAVDRALKRGQRAVQSQLQAKLVRQQQIKLQDNCPGREFVLEFQERSKARWLRSRIYGVNGVQYQIILVGDKDFVESGRSNEILNSFRLN